MAGGSVSEQKTRETRTELKNWLLFGECGAQPLPNASRDVQ